MIINLIQTKLNQNGTVLVLTMFLLIIIATLTLSFFYLQTLEVDIIAYETDYLQAFYLASAALDQGILQLSRYSDIKNIPTQAIQADFDPNVHGYPDPNVYGYFKYEHKGTWPVTVKASATVDDIERKIQISFFSELISETVFDPDISFDPDIYKDIAQLKKILQEPALGIINKSNVGDVSFATIDIDENNDFQVLIDSKTRISNKETRDISDIQKEAIEAFGDKVKNWTKQARRLSENDNGLLFYKGYIDYDGLGNKGRVIDSYRWSDWEYPEFNYREDRETEFSDSKRHTIIKPEMVVNAGEVVSLESGTYYFEELTLNKGATLRTKGEVIIFVDKCTLDDEAKMIGSTSGDQDKKLPENLIIFVEGPIDPKITLNQSAEVYGHILAPNGSVNMSTGKRGKKTLIQGSVLAENFNAVRNSFNYCKIGFTGWPVSNISILKPVPGSWREV